MSAAAMRQQPPDKVRAAPYCAEIEAALLRGECPNVRLFAGPRAWERGRNHRDGYGVATTLILPPATSPLSLRWPKVADIVGEITGLDGMAIEELAVALVRDGVRVAYLLDADRPERNLRVLRKRGCK
jgi:hypothetical protein